MEDNLGTLLDNLIGERIAYHGANAPSEKDATELDAAYKALYASLEGEQKGLAIAVENAQIKLHGEVESYYYRAGIADGISVIMGLLKQ